MQVFVANGRVAFIPQDAFKQYPDGKTSFKFDFACDSSLLRDGKPLTTFLHVQTSGKQAENLYHSLSVGSPILLKGELVDAPYTDGEGNKRVFRYVMPHKIDGVTYLESKEESLLRKERQASQ
ncbi:MULTISPECIES: single-stranded DNA-binding protein [unclassified Streptococcus]|uniref:single-stranded DNA-binding protein n=1 Tax=unclassified Streptococcus TaxID=2608887 RepID=UPI00211AC3D4|nr:MULTISPECIES: single-stranded DNA-binding protein [unclassified Streptococcus]MCQ9212401.1 single-stranded DNA-binding protein [Streptococcus sp. B01]MCQ9213741.1 single-stranded DNA-binding protein [Streptococcus sp. O1]MCQ9214498.1 single-stranded DNA-binding protein [Streptococcus sp. O1]